MLQELGGLDVNMHHPVPPGTVMPHLTRLSVYQGIPMWPEGVFPKLQSLQLIIDPSRVPCQPENIPGCSTVTELQLGIQADGTSRAHSPPDMEDIQGIRTAVTTSLELVIPRELERLCRADRVEVALALVEALAAFTQVQQLAVILPNSLATFPCLERAVRPDDMLRAISKLKQLQRLTLAGWPWGVSPILVEGLEAALPQLQEIRLEGCCGRGEHLDKKKAKAAQGIEQLRGSLRPGLQVVWKG